MSAENHIDVRTAYAIERAKRLGTYNQIDRRAQYDGPDRAQPGALLDAVNVQGNYIRQLQADKDRMQRSLMNLKLRNSLIVAIVTSIGWKLVEFFGPIALRWLGLS